MCTLHANSPRDALIRLENMLMMAGADMPLSALRRQIASAVDIVVQLARLRSGHRCVTSITNVVGIENDIVTTEELWRRRHTGRRAAHLRDFRAPAVLDGRRRRGQHARAPHGSASGGPENRGGRELNILVLIVAIVSGVVVVLGAVVLLGGRDRAFKQRLQGVGAPLSGHGPR